MRFRGNPQFHKQRNGDSRIIGEQWQGDDLEERVAWHGRNQDSFPINFQDVYERAILQGNILSDIEQGDQSAKRVKVIETTKFIILMGVTGSGKTTVGKALAERLGWDFFDGDDYHSIENIQKMSRGIPLTDEDRADWLNTLAGLIHQQLEKLEPGILACSALKQRYRRRLAAAGDAVSFVYLKGNPDIIRNRVKTRHDHYMRVEMVESQFAALEEPAGGLVLNIEQPVYDLVEEIIAYFKLN